MELLLPFMYSEQFPMARLIYNQLAFPLADDREVDADGQLLSCFNAIKELVETDMDFQITIFGHAVFLYSPDRITFNTKQAYAIVRAFGLQILQPSKLVTGNQQTQWLCKENCASIHKQSVWNLFKDVILKGLEPVGESADDMWVSLCPIKANYILRGAVKEKYHVCKALFYGSFQLLQNYLESTDSMFTILSILCLCSTFNLYSKIAALNVDLKDIQTYVDSLHVENVNEELLKEAVKNKDAQRFDQAVLQILKQGQGARYQSLFARLDLSSMFSETIDSLVSESLL